MSLSKIKSFFNDLLGNSDEKDVNSEPVDVETEEDEVEEVVEETNEENEEEDEDEEE